MDLNLNVLNQHVQKERFRKNSQTWLADAAAVFLLLRGGSFVGNPLTKTTMTILLRRVAFPNTAMLDFLLTLQGVDVYNFSPPLPTGWNPSQCTFITHLETFQKAFVAVIDDGTDTSGATATGRSEQLKVQIKRIVDRARDYLSLHSAEIAGHEVAVRSRLIHDTNTDVNEYLGASERSGAPSASPTTSPRRTPPTCTRPSPQRFLACTP